MKAIKWIAAGCLFAVGAQATIITDNLAQELNADDIGAFTDGSAWTGTGPNATLNDNSAVGGTADLAKVAATVNGGQTSPLVSNTLSTGAKGVAGQLGATTSFLTGTTLSLELWISPNFSGNPTTSQTIFETGGPTRGMSISLGDNTDGDSLNNNLRFAIKDASSSAFVDVALPANFSDGDLHQLAVTYDNVNNMSFYIDGALEGSIADAGEIDWDGTSIAGFWGTDGSGIGADGIGLDSTGEGDGSIAVFRQYSDVLTGTEVLQNYTSTLGVPEPSSLALLIGGVALLLATRKKMLV